MIGERFNKKYRHCFIALHNDNCWLFDMATGFFKKTIPVKK
jgi:hypothetical protein